MASTTLSSAVLDRPDRASVASPVSALIYVMFFAGLVAGIAGFALLAMGSEGWARSLFVGDLIAIVGSVSLGALAPRSPGRSH